MAARYIVNAAMTLAQDITTFDVASFKDIALQLLFPGVNNTHVDVLVITGSVVVLMQATASEYWAARAAVAILRQRTPSELSAALRLEVQAVDAVYIETVFLNAPFMPPSTTWRSPMLPPSLPLAGNASQDALTSVDSGSEQAGAIVASLFVVLCCVVSVGIAVTARRRAAPDKEDADKTLATRELAHSMPLDGTHFSTPKRKPKLRSERYENAITASRETALSAASSPTRSGAASPNEMASRAELSLADVQASLERTSFESDGSFEPAQASSVDGAVASATGLDHACGQPEKHTIHATTSTLNRARQSRKSRPSPSLEDVATLSPDHQVAVERVARELAPVPAPRRRTTSAPSPSEALVDTSSVDLEGFRRFACRLEPTKGYASDEAALTQRFEQMEPDAAGMVWLQDYRLMVLLEELADRANDLREQFALVSPDGNGSLDRRELSVALRSLGFHEWRCSEADIDLIFEHLDVDQSGSIDFQELALRV